jgi:transposase
MPCAGASKSRWGPRLAQTSRFKKARVAVARKLAVIHDAMWKTNTEFRWT